MTETDKRIAELKELKEDRKRLEWLMTEDGAVWLMERFTRSLTVTRKDIDIAR